MSNIAVEFSSITKKFPGVVANKSIDLKIEAGSIHGILGENGAGKTTLMNILYGLYEATEGSISVRGEKVDIQNPRDAINLGIGMIHQHFMLVETLSVAENVMLGKEHTKSHIENKNIKNFMPLDVTTATKEVNELSERYGLRVDPTALISEISVGIQQRVEIIKALKRGAKILILDEPTAVLTPQEADELVETLKRLRDEGATIIFITHKLEETMELCDRVTVLRGGEVVGTISVEEANPEKLARMMVGRDVVLRIEKPESTYKDVILQADNLVVNDERGLQVVNNISFELRRGEILGIAGVQGNGQTELIEAITGIRSIKSGHLLYKGQNITHYGAKRIRDQGIVHIPEDRQKHGLVLGFSVADNLILGSHNKPPFAKNGVRKEQPIREYSQKLVENFDIRTPSIMTRVEKLSGGNQQKVIVARELSQDFDLVVAAQPTRGLDVGVIEYIHEQLVSCLEKSKAVLLISSELKEIMMLSDRIAVIYEGKIVSIGSTEEYTREKLGLLMAGKKEELGGL